MILIWSGEGGPLQWLGIGVFILQFFAPQIFRLSLEIQDGSFDVGNGNYSSLWIVCSMAIAMGSMFVIWEFCLSEEEENANEDEGDNNSNNQTPAAAAAESSAPSGTAANPVVIEDNGDDDDFWIREMGRINALWQWFSPTHLMLALGFILPLAMAAPLLLNGLQNGGLTGMLENSAGVIPITILAIIAHSMMAIAAYRVLRDVLDGGGVGPYPGNRQGRRRGRKKLTVSDIAVIARKVAVEEFVSEQDIKMGECSIARMKRMLVNRGASDAAKQCVEKDDLIREVEKVRKFNEECAICAEEYAEGDVLRVMHCCRNEYHLHCFDKWIYTFATDSRPATHPTCPLCKATLK